MLIIGEIVKLTSMLISVFLLCCPIAIAQGGPLLTENSLPPKSEISCTVQEEPNLYQSLICKTTLHGTMRFMLLDENGLTRTLDEAKWTADMGVLMLPTNAIVVVQFVDIYGRPTMLIKQVFNVVGDRS